MLKEPKRIIAEEPLSPDSRDMEPGLFTVHWPDTPDELRQVTLKEIHWLCDGLSLNPRGAFEEHHPKIIL